MDIIPAILAKTEDEFVTKVGRVSQLGLRLQIDVIDGVFAANQTWAVPERMGPLLGEIPYEAHLMVATPEHAAPVWMAGGAYRVYFHAESTKVDDLIFRSLPNSDQPKLGIAINPDTPISRIVPSLKFIRSVLVMGVNPGWSGQEMLPTTIDKIKAIKKIDPAVYVAVDGGVTLANAKMLAQAGADGLVVGSALTDDPDPHAALARLLEALGM
jgi:ribulose-phosphate 3-epimerase